MGYLLKTEVMEALHEDKETSLMCYDDEATRAIIKFCYDSMEYELNQLQLQEECVVIPEIVAYLQMGEGERIPDYRCPQCGYGVVDDYVSCPHCSAVLNWEGVKVPSESTFRNLTSTDTYDSDFSLEEIEKQTEEHFQRMFEEQKRAKEMCQNCMRWIPIEEQLPEEGFANKLICDSDGNVKICTVYSEIKINGKTKFFPDNQELLALFIGLTGVPSVEELDDMTHIIAWMSVPKAYKLDGSEV